MAPEQRPSLVQDGLAQLRELWGVLLRTYAPAFAAILGMIWIASAADVPVAQFTRDPAAVMNGPFYAGALSNVGILMWCAAAAICFFGASLLQGKFERKAESRFLLTSALFTCLLLVDDLFMLHDLVLPEYLQVRERYVILTYGLLMLGYLVGFRRLILRTEWLVLCLAGCFFAGSIVVDKLPEDLLPMHHVFEDGFKFLGIVTWMLYLGRTTRSLLAESGDEL